MRLEELGNEWFALLDIGSFISVIERQLVLDLVGHYGSNGKTWLFAANGTQVGLFLRLALAVK